MVELEHNLDNRSLLYYEIDCLLSIENFDGIFFLCFSIEAFENFSIGSFPNLFQVQILVNLYKLLASILVPWATFIVISWLLFIFGT